MPGKRQWRGVASVGLLSSVKDAVPKLRMQVNDSTLTVLVDTGCSRCLVHVSCCGPWQRSDVGIITMDGAKHRCLGTTHVCLKLESEMPRIVEAIVIDFRPLNFDFVLGMNGVSAFGGAFIGADGEVLLGDQNHARACMGRNSAPAGAVTEVAAAQAEVPVAKQNKRELVNGIVIEEKDFTARYDAREKQWTAAWKWTDGREPPTLDNNVAQYAVKSSVREEYEREIAVWKERGWLKPYDECELGPPKGLIPLMAVVQKNKAKVRPVLDFRELNQHIEPFTANADVCAEKMRKW